MHASNATFELPTAADMVRRLIIAAGCAAIIVYSGVLPTMVSSSKTYRAFLYPAFFLYALFGAAWVYTATYLQKKDMRWFETHEKFLYGSTATIALASVLWIIGMWPEFSFWTIPLYMIMLTFVSHLVGLVPRIHAKTH